MASTVSLMRITPVTAQASVYDNFVVTNAAGWDIAAVFSDDLSNTVITGASWEIRSGVSAGNGGTLVASGSTLTPTITPTGRSGFGFTEYQVKVTGLSRSPATPASRPILLAQCHGDRQRHGTCL